MMGMVWKDFLVMRKQLGYYLAFCAVYAGLVLVGSMPYSVLAGMVAMVGVAVPMSSFAFDEQARWDKFAAAAPAGRRGIVLGKYLFALLSTGVGVVFTAGALTAMAAAGAIPVEAWWEPLAVVAACGCASLVMNSVYLPFLFKYGAEKARVLGIVTFGFIFGMCALLAWQSERSGTALALPAWLPGLLPLLAAAGTAAALACSLWMSMGIYRRKAL